MILKDTKYLDEAISEYMSQPSVKAALLSMDKEDIESHIKVAFKNGAKWAIENRFREFDDYFEELKKHIKK